MIEAAEVDEKATSNIFFPRYRHRWPGNIAFIAMGSRGILFYPVSRPTRNLLTVEV